jgi:hypothetical protein
VSVGIEPGPKYLSEPGDDQEPGPVKVHFTVTRSGGHGDGSPGSGHRAAVFYRIGLRNEANNLPADGAKYGKDYSSPGGKVGTIRFGKKATTQFITITAKKDWIDEDEEWFKIRLTGIRVSGDAIGKLWNREATGRIKDGTPEPYVLAVSGWEKRGMREGDSAHIRFVLRREDAYKSKPAFSTKPITVEYEVAPYEGSPTLSPDDFREVTGTVTIKRMKSRAIAVIQTVDDNIVEPREKFGVEITGLSTHAQFSSHRDRTKPILVRDNDKPKFAISAFPNYVVEGDEGDITPLFFNVSLESHTEKDTSVSFHTRQGTASWGDDFQGTLAEVVTFEKTEVGAQQKCHINILGDDKREPDEHFFVKLSETKRIRIVPNAGRIRLVIRNDDGPTGP